jgi:hypothetical protein
MNVTLRPEMQRVIDQFREEIERFSTAEIEAFIRAEIARDTKRILREYRRHYGKPG